MIKLVYIKKVLIMGKYKKQIKFIYNKFGLFGGASSLHNSSLVLAIL